MACFLVPMTLAIVTTLIRKNVPEKYKIDWLNALLWGGVIMLAVEHVAHQEIVPWPPFLTAMENPADIPVMLHEMATIGGAMTIAILLAWSIMVYTYNMMKVKLKTSTRV